MKLKELMSFKLNEEVDDKEYNIALEIIMKFKKAGFKETFIVGGYNRNKKVGIPSKDIDLVTEARPDDIYKVLADERYHILEESTGEKHGIIFVIVEGLQYEIATMREDGEYTDGRRPDEVIFSDKEHDALRRDFTVNSIFYDPIEDEYYDPTGGDADIARKIIRAVGDPNKRFEEDYLRMLRAVRFAAQLGFRIENSTLEAVKASAGNIKDISGERVKAEMDKILKSDKPGNGLKLLAKSGLLVTLFPEVADLVNYDQNPKFHPEGNVFIHT
ncbi:unnamed protein product, partial [marine sediment metagenome]